MRTRTTPVLNRILDPVGRLLTPEIAQALVNLRLDAKTQARLDRLADKCNEGKLSPKQRHDYEIYVAAIDLVSILQAKARAVLNRSRTAG